MNALPTPQQSVEQIEYQVNNIVVESKFHNSPVSVDAYNAELSKAIATYQRIEQWLAWANKYPKKYEKSIVLLNSIKPGLEQAIQAFKQNPCSIIYVQHLRRNAEFVLRELNLPVFGRVINGFKYVLYESTVPVKVLFGLVLGLPLYLAIPTLDYQAYIVNPILKPVLQETKTCAELSRDRAQPVPPAKANLRTVPSTGLTQCDVDQTIAHLILVGVAGALGSIISILTRIKEYETEKYTDAMLPVWIGAFKPLIGGTFGVLIFTLIYSGIVPLKLESGNKPINEWYTLYAIAFVAGFSERLVKDIISQTEDKFAGKKIVPDANTPQLKDMIDQLNAQMQILATQVSAQSPTTANGNHPAALQPVVHASLPSQAEPETGNGHEHN